MSLKGQWITVVGFDQSRLNPPLHPRGVQSNSKHLALRRVNKIRVLQGKGKRMGGCWIGSQEGLPFTCSGQISWVGSVEKRSREADIGNQWNAQAICK